MSQMLQSSSYAGAGEHLFLSEELSNMTISVQTEDQRRWRFPAHTLVLAAQSPVFRRMLESDFAEKATGSIVIKDIKPNIVEMLLGYIYKGKVNLENWHDALELLQAAHKYQVEPLVQHCTRFLENVIDLSNVCLIYNEACIYSLVTLKEKCYKLILDAGFITLQCKAFEILDKDAVMDIIMSPDLNVDSELMVFDALLRWAPMQCCRLGIPVNEENILQELVPFLKYLCSDDMSDTDKSALPPAVLSSLKPNNRSRTTPCVPKSLLQCAHYFNFHADQEVSECVADSLCCIRFSLDTPQYLIGLKFMAMTTEIPSPLLLSIVKESGGNPPITLHIINLSSADWKEGPQMYDRVRYDAQITLRQAFLIKARTVYKLQLADRSLSIYCPKTRLLKNTVLTQKGHVSLSLHVETTWGVTGFIFV